MENLEHRFEKGESSNPAKMDMSRTLWKHRNDSGNPQEKPLEKVDQTSTFKQKYSNEYLKSYMEHDKYMNNLKESYDKYIKDDKRIYDNDVIYIQGEMRKREICERGVRLIRKAKEIYITSQIKTRLIELQERQNILLFHYRLYDIEGIPANMLEDKARGAIDIMRNEFGIAPEKQDDPAVQRRLEKVNQIELAIDLFKQCKEISLDERQNMLKDQRKTLILEKKLMHKMDLILEYKQVQRNLYNRLIPTHLNRESWEDMNQEQRKHYYKIIKEAYDASEWLRLIRS